MSSSIGSKGDGHATIARDEATDVQLPVGDQEQDGDSMFINVTESLTLDKASRTRVRVQVMRDYHQRRVQKAAGKTKVQDVGQDPKKPSHRGKTQKFRLGKENFLKPWVPVKSKAGKRDKAAKPKLLKIEPHPEISNSHDFSILSRRVVAVIEDHLGNVDSGNAITDVITTSPTWASENTEVWNSEQYGEFLDGTLGYPLSIWETARIYQSPGAGLMDPFAAMSVLITPRTQLLLHHYFNVRMQSSWLMMPMRKTLFSLAVHDTAMFHSFLCHYATNFNVRFKTNDATETIYHATRAATLVNERLADPSRALTNETIATVANMAAFESSNGSMSSMVIHMDGLEKMVRLRGGLHDGGFPTIVQRMVGWADYHVATATLQKPRFSPLLLPQTEGPKGNPQSLQTAMPKYFPFKDTAVPNLDELFYGVRDLAEKLRIIRRAITPPSEDIWYSDKIYFLQRNLFDIAHGSSKASPVDGLCALAALMYCGHCLRDIPLSYAVTANAVTRLKNTLELLDMASILEQESWDKYFWVLGFGGVAAEGKQEQAWFVIKFRAMCDYLEFADWDAARPILDRILWAPELDAAGQRLWKLSLATDA